MILKTFTQKELKRKMDKVFYSDRTVTAIIPHPERFLMTESSLFLLKLKKSCLCCEKNDNRVNFYVKWTPKNNQVVRIYIQKDEISMKKSEMITAIKKAIAHLIANGLTKVYNLDYKSIVWALLTEEIKPDWVTPKAK